MSIRLQKWGLKYLHFLKQSSAISPHVEVSPTIQITYNYTSIEHTFPIRCHISNLENTATHSSVNLILNDSELPTKILAIQNID